MKPFADITRHVAEWARGAWLLVQFRLGKVRSDNGGLSVGVAADTNAKRRRAAQKINDALLILGKLAPCALSRARGDMAGILSAGLGGNGEIGRWERGPRLCVLDLQHVLDESPEEIAATIVHEATHARIMKMGIGYGERIRRRVEMVCNRAMIRLAKKMPSSREREAIVCGCREAMELPWAHWSDEKRALGAVSARRGIRRLQQEEDRAWKRRALDAGHLPSTGVTVRLESGVNGESGDSELVGFLCSAVFENREEVPLKVVWCGWMGMTEEGEWKEIVEGGIAAEGGIEIGAGEPLHRDGEFIPLLNITRGAMWACVTVDPSGITRYAEAVIDRLKRAKKWVEFGDWAVGSSSRGRLETGRILVDHKELNANEVGAVAGASRVAAGVQRDYGAFSIHPYRTEIKNCADERIRVIWMQSYSRGEGGNIMGRVLGPSDFSRWFGGEEAQDQDWMEPGQAMRCDFNWSIAGGIVKWSYRAVGQSGKIYSQDSEVDLLSPVFVEDLFLKTRERGEKSH